MDVRGPAESHDANNNLSQVRRGPLRFESADGMPNSKLPQFTPHTTAPEIVRLTETLKDIPEVREELVARIIEKLRAGEYSSRRSAERTAEAILGTSE